MKKFLVLFLTVALACCLLCGCGSSGGSDIAVISREEGSGTRGAFVELFGIEKENENGDKEDFTTIDADITNSTSVMMTSVAGNTNAIGYISLGSLNDTVKAVSVNGVEASIQNIKSGSYEISRPFNIVTHATLSEAAQAFIDFIMSSEGQAIIEENGYIPASDNAQAFTGNSVAGKVVVAGSSSVTPVMEKLKEAYMEVNPKAEIEVQQSDSSTGINMAIEGSCDIGMASRSLKESEISAGAHETSIADDGVVVIVNNENSVSDLSKEQVCAIYTGEILSWDEIR